MSNRSRPKKGTGEDDATAGCIFGFNRRPSVLAALMQQNQAIIQQMQEDRAAREAQLRERGQKS